MSLKRANIPESEDSVECLIFPMKPEDLSLEELQLYINLTIKEITKGYIWHKEELRVFSTLNNENTKDLPVHLKSITSFGDNIDDEWFIVYIVLELTKRYQDVVIQLQDSDGDFLLIEAADHLPSWANPDSTHNRVFLYRGHIHLIPPNILALDSDIKLYEALHHIVHNTNDTLASPNIEKCIIDRIGNYPSKINTDIHHAVVELPVDIAALLKLKPELIAQLVTSYCHRDVLDEKVCKKLNFDQTVLQRIKFTKCLYAMILHSKPIKQNKMLKENDRKRSLGQKLCCGYQIIMSAATDMFSSKQYQKFIGSLKDNGYFKNNIEGSQEYKKLLEQANQYFVSMECPLKTSTSTSITQLLSSKEYLEALEALKTETNLDIELNDDNEDWLEIKPEQLNNMLNTRYGKKSKFGKHDIINPENITAELTRFLNNTSDLEGIESGEKDTNESSEIDFNCDKFVDCVENMLKLITSDVNDAADFSDDESMMDSDDIESDTALDDEVKNKLRGYDENSSNDKTVFDNIFKSMKEEKAFSGPSSNLLTTIGIQKTDILDSDDE